MKRSWRHFIKPVLCLAGIVVLLGAGPVPSWLILHSGVRAFTLDDGADATMATVCPTLPLYLHGPDDAAAPRCLHERPGVSVVIESIDGRRCVDFESQTRVPCVRIRAMDGSWSGYTGATTVAPAVPVGTLVDLAPQPIERLTLAPKPAWKSGEGTDLGARVRARVIRYVPSTDERELFVSIINGPHVGATGWVYAHTATLGGLSVTEFLTGPASQRR